MNRETKHMYFYYLQGNDRLGLDVHVLHRPRSNLEFQRVIWKGS